jgi:ParB-like chromosome segregation protein Spo0J
MAAAPVLIPLDQLRPHPDNPRLFERAEVVGQIAFQIGRVGGFDPAYALLVRPLGDAFQIVTGHHRLAAGRACGLDAVPCWVREMDDDEAFMALVLANSQSEFLPLERGLHALRSGTGVREYAHSIERAPSLVVRKRQAAEVFTQVNGDPGLLANKAKQLAEIRVASSWLWPALVARLMAEGWNVETTRGHASRLKDVPKPSTLADREEIAAAIAAGTFRPGDVARMIAAEQAASAKHALIVRPLDGGSYQIIAGHHPGRGRGSITLLGLRRRAGERKEAGSSCLPPARLEGNASSRKATLERVGRLGWVDPAAVIAGCDRLLCLRGRCRERSAWRYRFRDRSPSATPRSSGCAPAPAT